MKKLFLLFIYAFIASNSKIIAQPVFKYAGQTIELSMPLQTSDNNPSSIIVNGSAVTVTKYRFEFSTSNTFPEYQSPNDPTGWFYEVNPGDLYRRISIDVPKLEIGQTYHVRILYLSNNVWSSAVTSDSFSTYFSSNNKFSYAHGSNVDLFNECLLANDNNTYYPNYRFEFSQDPLFTEYTSANNYSPPGLFGVTGRGSNNAPNIGSLPSCSLKVDQQYYVRVRVKTSTMSTWSAPGGVTMFNTINTRAFYYSNNSNLDLFTDGLVANDYNLRYAVYRFEFSTNNTFPEYTTQIPNPTGWYGETSANSNNSPYIGALATQLVVNQTYFVRVKVKLPNMTTWSSPGPVRSFNTVNKRKFYYCNASALNIKQECLISTDLSPYYANYKYEFATDAAFTSNVLSHEGVYNSANCIRLKTILPSMLYNTPYWARVSVKTANMQNWSLPGPVCTFTTGACVPDATACPVYAGNCAYTPRSYFTFDNDCQRTKDCITNNLQYEFNWATANVSYPNSGKVGTCFAPKLKANSGASATQYAFPANFPSSNYNGDYTLEFGFKLGYDGTFILYGQNGTTPANGDYRLPYFEINSLQIRVILRESTGNSYQRIEQYLTGLGVLSPGYYFDSNWHHAALKYNSSTKLFELFIDGQSPPQFKITLTGTQSPVPPDNTTVLLYTAYSTTKAHSMDEVAFYDQALPDNIIYQHRNNFNAQAHYNACNINNNVSAPVQLATTGPYDPSDYVPGYNTDVLIPGKATTYYHCDLTTNIKATAEQIETYPLPRFKNGHTLNPNINWTDAWYLGGTYSGGCGSLVWSPNPANDVRIQTELCKNWNYMFSLGKYNNHSETSVINNALNSNPQLKIALISNIHDQQNTWIANNGIINQIKNNDISLTVPLFNNPNNCNYTPATFKDPRYIDDNKLYGRLLFKDVVDRYYKAPQPSVPGWVSLTRKIDFVSDNGWETGLYAPDRTVNSCLFASEPALDNARLALSVPNNPVVPGSATPTWDDYYGHLAGAKYKTYSDALINDNGSAIYDGKNSSDIFHPNTKMLFYLISSIAGHNSTFFDNYNTKRSCNSQYNYISASGNFSSYLSTPNFYPWTGPLGWYASGGPRWGIGELYHRVNYEIPIGDRMFAPYVSARWGRDVETMRPGQYLGFLKAIAMFGVDFFHAGYFNVTESSVWPVKKQSGDNVGFANDTRTWVWQLATTSYAQALSSRYENIIKDCDYVTAEKFGDEYYVINKQKNQNKYLIYGTVQTISNMLGASPLSKDIVLNNFTAIDPPFKINVRRQGSTYVLDLSGTNPVFYQLDKWHESTHPSFWTKDFDFEAEVDDSGNSIPLVTERPNGAAPNDYTNFTTAAELNTSNSLKFDFTPRDPNNLNNDYQIWVRMKLKNTTSGAGRVEIKYDGTNTFIVEDVNSTTWQWYGYESCGASRMLLDNLSPTTHSIVITAGTSNLLIDQVSLKTNQALTWQSPPTPCTGCCSTFVYRSAPTAADSLASEPLLIKAEANYGLVHEISVSPNPMSDVCELYSEIIKSGTEYNISITSILGIKVKTFSVSGVNGVIKLNVSDIPNGAYNLQISDKTSGVLGVKRIIIQH